MQQFKKTASLIVSDCYKLSGLQQSQILDTTSSIKYILGNFFLVWIGPIEVPRVLFALSVPIFPGF
jgi:hypothetical protein